MSFHHFKFKFFRWLSLSTEVKDYVKSCILRTLGTEGRPSTAAQCIAAIACIELPANVCFLNLRTVLLVLAKPSSIFFG